MSCLHFLSKERSRAQGGQGFRRKKKGTKGSWVLGEGERDKNNPPLVLGRKERRVNGEKGGARSAIPRVGGSSCG